MLARSALTISLALAAVTCGPAPSKPETAAPATEDQAPVIMIGPLQRSDVEAKLPQWKSDAALDPEAVKGLSTVPPGAEVTIVFGTWCGDSHREVPRLWRAFDAAGELPFTVTHIGLDDDKTAPGFDKAGTDLRYVPTIIIKRDGAEVGRIVESTTAPIERELWQLLQGTKSGLVTARTDLAAP